MGSEVTRGTAGLEVEHLKGQLVRSNGVELCWAFSVVNEDRNNTCSVSLLLFINSTYLYMFCIHFF